MFDLNKFYDDAYSGQKIYETNAFVEYAKSFNSVIIWGVGNLGRIVYEKISSLGISVTVFWDQQYEEIKSFSDVAIIEPFTGKFDKSSTLVIFCIANVPVSPRLFALLAERGWKNTIKGLAILQGLICPMSFDTTINTALCAKNKACVVCSCERLNNLMKHYICKNKNITPEEILSFDRIHFIVNNFCNLKCKHCFMYMNTYPNKLKKNMRLLDIAQDIDKIMFAIDSFGVVNIFGGETFLNPEVGDITRHILKHKNYGSIIVNTNGVAPIKKSQITHMKDSRIRIAFSNYLGSLSKVQEKIFAHNIKELQNFGCNVQTNNKMPTWNISSTLQRKNFTHEELCQKKKSCGVVFLYYFDGKLFPCAMCLSINDLQIADYKSDYIDIRSSQSTAELRDEIIRLMKKDHYNTCAHCDDCSKLFATAAGEQGFDKRYALEDKQ